MSVRPITYLTTSTGNRLLKRLVPITAYLLMAALAAPPAFTQAIEEAEQALLFGDSARAASRLKEAADQGDTEAQIKLGELHESGTGILQNYAEAARWYTIAAEAGSAKARNRLARMYASGLGVEKDPERAFEMFSNAAESAVPQYVFDLAVAHETGIGTERDPERAARLYEAAAIGGLDDATANLALLYYEGRGVERDLEKARQLLSQAAEAGVAKAQNNLGLMYTRGDGVEQDYAVAAEWFRKAADQGLPMAMTNLGVMYANGFGVEVNEQLAAELYRKGGQRDRAGQAIPIQSIPFVYDQRLVPLEASPAAFQTILVAARQGDPLAQFGAGFVALSAPFGGEPNYAEGARWMQAAAEKGVSSAMTNLGLLYFRGRGVPQDFVRGYMWLNRAAASGLPDVVAIRDLAAIRMTAGQINDAQELAVELLAAESELGR
jgi:TPR repeat protein